MQRAFRLSACPSSAQGNALGAARITFGTITIEVRRRVAFHRTKPDPSGVQYEAPQPLITGELHPAMFGYICGVANGLNCPAIIAGGVADHVHILFALHKTIALCKAVEQIKKESSKWAKENGGPSNFFWQNGYGAFSVSPPHVSRVVAYIENQERHHAELPFQDEFRDMLRRSGEECDERTVWD